jgi:hypothetical protein
VSGQKVSETSATNSPSARASQLLDFGAEGVRDLCHQFSIRVRHPTTRLWVAPQTGVAEICERLPYYIDQCRSQRIPWLNRKTVVKGADLRGVQRAAFFNLAVWLGLQWRHCS